LLFKETKSNLDSDKPKQNDGAFPMVGNLKFIPATRSDISQLDDVKSGKYWLYDKYTMTEPFHRQRESFKVFCWTRKYVNTE
jgi:hypothetical protein